MNSLHQDELLDIVNEHDEVIGQRWRSQLDLGKDYTIRSINVFIENEHGQLWIPRRSPHKKILPLALDMSVSGCVSSGETYEQAFAREVAEEVNLDINKVPWEFLGYLTPHDSGVSFFMKVYKIRVNDVPNFNQDDFCEYYWLKPQEVMHKITVGKEQTKASMPILLKKFYTSTSIDSRISSL